MSPNRCAAYARYSSDRQSPQSIDDQLRMCRNFAEGHGLEIVEDHVYTDAAVSGESDERLGLERLLGAAFSSVRPFDTILVDDTSRLARNLADAMRLYQRLNFAGVRVVAVSQGIDTSDEQADVLVTVHGLVDALYVKELAKKLTAG